MKVSRNSALKLWLTLALVCLYSLAGFSDSSAASDGGARAENKGRADKADKNDKSDKNGSASKSVPKGYENPNPPKWKMTLKEAEELSAGCLDCHRGIEDMHNGDLARGVLTF